MKNPAQPAVEKHMFMYFFFIDLRCEKYHCHDLKSLVDIYSWLKSPQEISDLGKNT